MKCLKSMGIVILLLTGCSDIFEKNISEKRVDLVAPADQAETFHPVLTFAWEEVEGATDYRLIVVSPSFEEAQLYVLDTLIAGHQFSRQLQPGRYEWKVRPENSAYQGLYTSRVVTVLNEDRPEGI